ncbi:LysR substrate-binding domain-containing protein [Undibacterium baiyunense]|uniref:LysR family transcriptional regulator n=1 Tax=Undibacterium baiyunense TaxID=2828731 RepID=A0A941DIQ4_9BURK|nr:LysR substrate-binding domain-containing protein [Undibacterium baiyunense]MBR7746967.1 LysR family transcriptional regulator [Undibacterium baiyunense]
MRRKVPSLNALLVFEAAARLQSFTQAADELALTQSAVCKQIANLEDWLGLALFARVKKRVQLSSAGRDYAEKIRRHLDKIERDTLELMAHKEGAGVLELAVIPTFATQWLIPRLAEFQQLRPDITVNLSTRTSAFLFPDSLFHAAIHSGNAVWPGTKGDYLMAEDQAIPVCSPQLLRKYLGRKKQANLQDLAQMPLLHLSTRLEDWRRWFDLHQHENDICAVNGARYELFTMLIEAAIAGLGVALIPRYMVKNHLDNGKLQIPIDLSLPEQTGYYLVYPEENANLPTLQAFRSWLLLQTAQTEQTGPATQ